MANASVFTPLFDEDAVRAPNYFNGRLLSGEDLTTERRADREERRRLARATGDGVVRGLQVQKTVADTPTVTVTAGLALDRTGDSVVLHNDIDVSLLVLKRAMGEPETVEPFASCKPPESGAYVTGAGVYLLTIRRAAGSTGFAPVSGLGNELAGCNRRYVVEGVEFRMSQIPVSSTLLSNTNRLRNRLAYSCFRTERTAARIGSVFAPTPADDDLVSPMRANGAIGNCDVPLAVIHWRGAVIEFVDTWAVRRRPSASTPGTAADWLDPAQIPVGEARLLQFQAQLAEILSGSSSPTTVLARTHFEQMPPAAFLPITGVREEGVRLRPASPSTQRVINYESFFGARMKALPRVIEGARVGMLVRESLSCPPIDLDGDQMFWLYAVRENMQAVQRSSVVIPYLIVASPHLRFQAEPRFDVSYSNYANFL
jgi:hypothetical protein